MHFSTTSFVAALAAGTALAAPAPESPAKDSVKHFLKRSFTSFAITHEGSPIANLPLQARGGFIYLGGEPSTYCPHAEVPKCPPGKVTAFYVDNNSTSASLDVEVPGGQQLFVYDNGLLGYAQAHSEPPSTGVDLFTFHRHRNLRHGRHEGFWNFNDHHFHACVVPNSDPVEYAVLGRAKDYVRKPEPECYEFLAVTINYYHHGEPAAWQYD